MRPLQVNVRIGAGAVVAAAALGWLLLGPRMHLVTGGTVSEVSTTAASDRPPEIIPTDGGLLVIARIKGYETFTRADDRTLSLFFDQLQIPLGTTASEIRTAALYQYQVRLEKKWPIRCTATRCVVRTGPVELAQPVAIYSAETTRRTENGWARFDKAENLAQLERDLGSLLAQRGMSARNRDVGLRDGRKTVRQFVATWLQKETGRTPEIVVLFPGEREAESAAAAQAGT
jgi:hypothetical protein